MVCEKASHRRGDEEMALVKTGSPKRVRVFSMPLGDPATARAFNSTQLSTGISIMKCQMPIIMYFKGGLCQIAGPPRSCPRKSFKTLLLFLPLALSPSNWASPRAPSPCLQQLRQEMSQPLPSLSRSCFSGCPSQLPLTRPLVQEEIILLRVSAGSYSH